MTTRKSKPPFEAARAEAIERLTDAIADLKRLNERDFAACDTWGPYEQRYSMIRSTIHQSLDAMDKIDPYARKQAAATPANVSDRLAAIEHKKPLALEHKTGLY